MDSITVRGIDPSGFRLERTNPRHLPARQEPPAASPTSSFFARALDGVNADQQEHQALALQAVVDPESVNAHDVTVAAAKADLSLRITKNVVDRVIQAYREIVSIR